MASSERPSINPPEIQALGITQEGDPTRWRARGHVEGIGWLETWGTRLIDAMEALQALAAQRVAELTTSKQTNREDRPSGPTHEAEA
jgi:hypothetical protein